MLHLANFIRPAPTTLPDIGGFLIFFYFAGCLFIPNQSVMINKCCSTVISIVLAKYNYTLQHDRKSCIANVFWYFESQLLTFCTSGWLHAARFCGPPTRKVTVVRGTRRYLWPRLWNGGRTSHCETKDSLQQNCDRNLGSHDGPTSTNQTDTNDADDVLFLHTDADSRTRRLRFSFYWSAVGRHQTSCH